MKHYFKSFIQSLSNIRFTTLIVILVVFLMALFLLSLSIGASGLDSQKVWEYLFFGNGDAITGNIFYYVRLPRSFAALFCGSSLALAGLMFQSALNNALASAGTIGVNSGAGLFVILGALIFPGVFMAKTVFAFVGALLASMLVFLIAKKTEASRSMIIMIGIAVSSLLAAGSDTLVTIFPETLFDKSSFFIGGFANVQMRTLANVFPIGIIGLIAAIILSVRMNVLSLGDEVAQSLGLEVKRCRFALLFFASLLAAVSVCIGGLLSFVGLVVPHMMRKLIGTDYKKLVPIVALGGGLLVLGCDVIARTIFSPYEIPVGIVLSCLGAPFFLMLIIQKKRRLNI